MPNFTGKVALVTGASSGIGRGTAVYLSSLGCRVSISGRDQAALDETRRQCVDAGAPADHILCVLGDLTDQAFCTELTKRTVEKFGKLDHLVNSAGSIVKGGLEGSSMADYDLMMNVNVRSMVMLTKECIPHLSSTKGTVVNVSSINGPCSFASVTFYCMSKAAVDQLTKCLALELAPKGVRVNAVNPGVIKTNVHMRGGLNEQQYAAFLEHSKTTHALGRVGEVQEVAKAIGFLASDDSSFTTGQLLRVDGGRGIITPR